MGSQCPLQQAVSYQGNGTPQQMYSVQTINQSQNFPQEATGAIQYTQPYNAGSMQVPVSQSGFVPNPAVPGTTYYGLAADGTLHCITTPQGFGSSVQGAAFMSPPVPNITTGLIQHRSRTPPNASNPSGPNGQFIATTSNTVSNMAATPNMIRPTMVPHQMPTSGGTIPITPGYYPNMRPTRTTPPPQPLSSQVHPQSPVQYLTNNSSCNSPTSGTTIPGVISAGGTTFYQPPGGEHLVHPTQLHTAAAASTVVPMGE